jgi:hypothetical protein
MTTTKTPLINPECFARIIGRQENIRSLETLAIVLEAQCELPPDQQCLLPISSLRSTLEIKAYREECTQHHVWIPTLARVLLIGNGQLHGRSILLLVQGYGKSSHICGYAICIRPLVHIMSARYKSCVGFSSPAVSAQN